MENIKQIKVNEELHDIEDAQARSDIASEVTNRTNADKALDDKVKAETEARTSADNALNQKIVQETTNRTNADNALQEKINTNKNDISKLKEDLANKLPKSPADWENWTKAEQAVVRAMTGAYHVDFIGEVETEEEVASISFDFEARSADRIITIIEIPPVSIVKPMNISIITDKGTSMIVQFGSGDQSTSQMRCFISDTILLGPVAVSHNGSKSTNTSILSGTESIFINDKIDKLSIRSVTINNNIPLPIGTKASLYMGA